MHGRELPKQEHFEMLGAEPPKDHLPVFETAR
jgi:hypothetical protein